MHRNLKCIRPTPYRWQIWCALHVLYIQKKTFFSLGTFFWLSAEFGLNLKKKFDAFKSISLFFLPVCRVRMSTLFACTPFVWPFTKKKPFFSHARKVFMSRVRLNELGEKKKYLNKKTPRRGLWC